MIISQIIGGLGNQMFQYAAGRSLSIGRNQAFLLDIAGFVDYGLHQGFELQRVFNCPAKTATKSDLRYVLGWQVSSIVRRLLARSSLAAWRREGLVIEPHFHYWPGINHVPQDCYLAGYWQSQKYFQTQTAAIRADFTFKSALTKQNAELARQIGQVNAVSLHVRRGDFIHDPKANVIHGVCSLDYYQAAIRHISDRLELPYFFIFSDDIEWVRDHLKMDWPCQYVDHNQAAENYNDMRLMSLCRHHIIANSSFSWWGAWLNPSAEKIVVAPNKWFNNGNTVVDLIPHTWVTL